MNTEELAALCGLGHMLSSVLIGLIGIGIGVALGQLVALVFSVTTLATMVGAVLIGRHALNLMPGGKLERYSHELTGLALFVCGVGMLQFGL